MGGLIQDQNLRIGSQPARQDHLLLVAAAQVLDRLIGRGGGDVQQPDVSIGQLVLLLPAQES
jgi:hypothetical protein